MRANHTMLSHATGTVRTSSARPPGDSDVGARSGVRLPIQVSTIGLVLVLLVLSVFSVAVSITNARGTDRAQSAAADSNLYEMASEALLAQELSAEEVVAEGDAESLAD